MARPDGRIEKGQRLSSAISARAWNRAQEAADRVLGAQPGVEAGPLTQAERAANVVLVQNDSGIDVPACGVLSISHPLINPSGGNLTGDADADKRARSFFQQPVLIGVAPLSSSHDWRIAVALEPIAQGKIGRFAVGGVFPCKVMTVPQGGRYATIKDGDVTQLVQSTCGPVFLLWVESGTGPGKWAVGVI